MTKKDLIKQWEYDTKLLMLRIKYSKKIWETLALSMSCVMGAVQLRTKLSQPNPKFKSGVAIISDNSKPEIIQRA